MSPHLKKHALTDLIARAFGSRQVFQDGGLTCRQNWTDCQKFSVPEYAAVLVRNKIPTGIGNHNSGVDKSKGVSSKVECRMLRLCKVVRMEAHFAHFAYFAHVAQIYIVSAFKLLGTFFR